MKSERMVYRGSTDPAECISDLLSHLSRVCPETAARLEREHDRALDWLDCENEDLSAAEALLAALESELARLAPAGVRFESRDRGWEVEYGYWPEEATC